MQNYQTVSATRAKTEALNAFMRGVYGWMTAGLGITAAVALFTASSPTMLQALFSNQLMGMAVIFSPVILALVLIAKIKTMNPGTATGLFLVYSGLMGLSLSTVLLVYTGASVFQTFVVCAGMFGSMTVYGMVTKRDLTSMGSFMTMGLIGIIIAMIVNIFLKSSGLEMIISGLGVIIFTGLTAWDTQKLKVMGETAPADDTAAIRRGTILGALTLYLDFINLFLFLLRFMGNSRN